MSIRRSVTAYAAVGTMLISALVVSGCGDPTSTENGVVPLSVGIIAQADIGPATGGAWKHVDANLNKVPAWALASSQIPSRDEGAQIFLDKLPGKLTYAQDIKPWLGRYAGFGATIPKTADADDARIIAWAESTDNSAAEEAIAKAAKKGGKTTTYKGVKIHSKKRGDETVFLARIGDNVVLTDTLSLMKESIKANDSGKTLEDSKEVEEVLKPIRNHADAIAEVVVPSASMEKLLAVAKDAAADMAVIEKRSFTPVEEFLAVAADKKVGWGMRLGANKSGFFLDNTFSSGSDMLSANSGNARNMTDRLPATSLAALATDGGIASSAFDDIMAETTAGSASMSSSVDQLAGIGAFKKTPQVGELLGFVSDVLETVDSKEISELTQKAYGESPSTGTALFIDKSKSLALGAVGDYEDGEALTEQDNAVYSAVDKAADRHDGFGLIWKRSGDRVTSTLTGVGDALAAVSTNSMYQKVLKAPQFSAFTGDAITGVGWRDDEYDYSIFPASAEKELAGAAAADGLNANKNFVRDMKAADVPDSAFMLAWLDTEGVATEIVEPLAGSAGAIISGQVSHIGNMVLWGAVDDNKMSDTLQFSLVLPVYK